MKRVAYFILLAIGLAYAASSITHQHLVKEIYKEQVAMIDDLLPSSISAEQQEELFSNPLYKLKIRTLTQQTNRYAPGDWIFDLSIYLPLICIGSWGAFNKNPRLR